MCNLGFVWEFWGNRSGTGLGRREVRIGEFLEGLLEEILPPGVPGDREIAGRGSTFSEAGLPLKNQNTLD